MIVKALVLVLAAVPAHRHRIFVASCRFVHVVPNASETAANVLRVQRAPPVASIRVCEVGERRVARPNLTDVNLTVLFEREHALLEPVVINLVARVLFYTRVDDGDDLHPEFTQTRKHCGSIRVKLFVPGENSIAVHVVNVEPQRVERNVELGVLGRERLNVGLLVGIPAALVKAECPKGRQGGAAGQLGVVHQNFGNRRRPENILGVLTAVEVNLDFIF